VKEREFSKFAIIPSRWIVRPCGDSVLRFNRGALGRAVSPQTNGICERFHKSALNEFYRVAFRKRVYR
jgi:hypothetical protein